MPWPAGPPPLLVKVAPDLTPDEMKVISLNKFCLPIDPLLQATRLWAVPGVAAEWRYLCSFAGMLWCQSASY